MSDLVTTDRPGGPRWVSLTVHFPVTCIVLYLGGIAVLPILAVHFVYAASPEPWSGGPPPSSPSAAHSVEPIVLTGENEERLR